MCIDEVIEYNRLYREKLEGIVMQDAATIGSLKEVTVSQSERIEKLEQQVEQLGVTLRQSTANLTAMIADGAETNAEIDCMLRQRVDEQGERIEKLEAALRDVVCCLIDGKVDMAAPIPDEFHGHRILGSKSVQTMVEVYHRLKAQMGDPGYDTP